MAQRKVSAWDFYGGVGDAISIDPDTGEEFMEGEPEPEPGDDVVERGGPGSGHHGHEGRPGERGGSLPGDATAQGDVSQRHHHTPVATGETLPDDLPFPTWANNRHGYSTDTFSSVYDDIIAEYGQDTMEARYAAETLRWMMEEHGQFGPAAVAQYGLTHDESQAVNVNVQEWLWRHAEENEDEAYLQATGTSEDDEPEPEDETEPLPEFEAGIQKAADGVYEAMTSKFAEQKFGVDKDEVEYLKAYLAAIARGRETAPSPSDFGMSPEHAGELRDIVQEYLTTLDTRYQETREYTGDLSTAKADGDDLMLVSRELEAEEWQNDAMGIASAAIYKALVGDKDYADWETTVLRDGQNPVALLMTEDLSVPMTNTHADFSPEVIDKLVPEGKYLYVHYVASEERGKGYGTYMMTKALQTAAAKGQGVMGGSVPEAKSFYEKLGAKFVATGRTPGFDSLSLAYLSPEQVAALYENMGRPVLKATFALLPEDEPHGPMFVSPSILALARDRQRAKRVVTPVLRRMITKGRGNG